MRAEELAEPPPKRGQGRKGTKGKVPLGSKGTKSSSREFARRQRPLRGPKGNLDPLSSRPSNPVPHLRCQGKLTIFHPKV